VANPPPDDRPDAGGGAVNELEAERAGTAYWREVARQRRLEAARVQKRPVVRAAIALDRRTASLQARASAALHAVRAARSQAAVRMGAATHRRELTRRRSELQAALDAAAQLTAAGGGVPAPVEIIELGDQPTGSAPVVCVTHRAHRPLAAEWSAALAAVIEDGATVATPQVLHPERPSSTASAHDLLVRWEGVELSIIDGVPVPVSRRAGAPPRVVAPSVPVPLSGPTALALARTTWDRLGGVDPSVPDDAALVELSLRAVLDQGGEVRTAPAALLSDERPVLAPQELVHPIAPDGGGWRAMVERHGPALVRRAGGATGRATVAITTATPSRKMAPTSGDWHYAVSFAEALERAGHPVRLQTIDEADDLAGRACDVHVVLRGLEPVRRTSGQRHVLWIISHPEAVDVAECDDADLVLVASQRFADHLRTRTDTPVEVCWQATDPTRFRPRPTDPAHRHPLTVVANTRGFVRTAVADARTAGLELAIYGTGWAGSVDPRWLVGDYVNQDELPVVYSSATVVLNDHWETMRRWGFVSNRIFDVLATGTPIVSDHLIEIETLFGTSVPTWNSPEELATVIEAIHADPDAAAARASHGRAQVLAGHTFDHRVEQLDALLREHGLTTEDRA
jgi:hypothetical protein